MRLDFVHLLLAYFLIHRASAWVFPPFGNRPNDIWTSVAMSKTVTEIKTSNAPAPVGPYSQAVLVGSTLYCSGQIALNPATGEFVGEGDVQEEARQVLKNLNAVLSEAGAETYMQAVRQVGGERVLSQVIESHWRRNIHTRADRQVGARKNGIGSLIYILMTA